MIKIKLNQYNYINSLNGFIILQVNHCVNILTSDFQFVKKLYCLSFLNPIIVNDSLTRSLELPNAYYVCMDPRRFISMENKCLKDRDDYHYCVEKKDYNYLYKVPKNIKCLIKNNIYDQLSIMIYYLLKKFLIKDCCQLILEIILQLQILDYTLYQNIDY